MLLPALRVNRAAAHPTSCGRQERQQEEWMACRLGSDHPPEWLLFESGPEQACRRSESCVDPPQRGTRRRGALSCCRTIRFAS